MSNPRERSPKEQALDSFRNNQADITNDREHAQAVLSLHNHNWICSHWRWSSCQTLTKREAELANREQYYQDIIEELEEGNVEPAVYFLRTEYKKVLPSMLDAFGASGMGYLGHMHLAARQATASGMVRLAHDLERSTTKSRVLRLLTFQK